MWLACYPLIFITFQAFFQVSCAEPISFPLFSSAECERDTDSSELKSRNMGAQLEVSDEMTKPVGGEL